MATQPVKGVVRHVKPLISTTHEEAKRRVIQLYKAWYRDIPSIIIDNSLTVTVSQCREQLRKEFLKHKDVKDMRVIDILVLKGQMEYKEVKLGFKQSCHIMYFFKDTQLKPPTNFLSKFFSGAD